LEHSSRPASTLWVNMMARGGQVGDSLSASLIKIHTKFVCGERAAPCVMLP